MSSPEFELLLTSCVGAVDGGSPRRLKLLLQSSLDWTQVTRLAQHHDVDAQLSPVLSRFPDVVPGSVIEKLHRAHERNAHKNLRLTRELICLLECLESHGIPAIPYKGPALAQAVFGNIALRQFSDLDILIHPADLTRAKTAVRELGYAPVVHLTESREKAYLASGYECSFDGPAGKNLLELQWRILPRFYAVELSVDRLFERSTTFVLGGKTIRTLSAEDLLIVLYLHATKHAWARLSHLRDIVGVVQTQRVNYDVVVAESRRLGIERILGVSFWLMNSLVGIPVPSSIKEILIRDREIAALGTAMREILLRDSEFNPERLDYFRLMLRLRERRRDKFIFLSRLLLTPGAGEWSAVRLPKPFSPLYGLVRLGRLSARAVSGRRDG